MTQAERDEIRALVLSFSTKISDLPEVEALQDGDYVVVVQNDGSKKHSKKATLESLLELIKIYYPDHNGAKYQGVAHPNDNIVNLPIGTDGFWFAIDAGVYTNYGGIVVGNSPKTLLYNAETHEWTSEDLWGDINGTVGFRLIDSSIENSLETFRIPVIQNRPYIISANARPSGSFAVLNIYEYDYTGELIGSIGYHVPEHSFTPREGTAYIKIGLGYNSSNPIAVELSEVRVTSSIKTLIEGLTDFVVDVLQGEYATHFGNIEDNINAILDRVRANEVNIATLQQSVSELGTGLDSLSSRTGIIAGDVAQLVIDTSGISTRLENTEQDVHELSITAGGLDERITNNQNDIFSLNTRASGLEVEVQNANRDITSLQITAQGLDTRITSAQGDVDELEITARGLSQRVSNAEGDIHTLESTATTLESNIGAVDGRISTLSQTVERIDAKVENNEGEIAGLAVEAHRIDLYAQSVNTNLGNYEAYANGVMAGLQEQLDGAIDTYFYDYMPVHVDATGAPDSQVPLIEVTVGGVTIPCEPYASWYATDEGGTAQEVNTERLKHLGDVFYDNKSGYAFRFSNTGTSDSPIFAWAVITDSAVIRALADAARAQDTADHKRRVFVYSPSYPTPYAPYDVGDLWVKPVTVGTGASAQSTTELYRCKTAREKTTNTFPFNPAVNTDTTSSGCDWEIADGYGTIVNKANLEILSDAIIGSVSQTTFDYENGIITSQCSSTIRQTANEIKLAISNGAIDTAVATNGKINKPLLDTGIDITNGNIVLTANHIALKNQNDQTGLELTTIGTSPDQKVVIDVGSLNVSGIFTTSAWLGTGGVGGERNSVLSDAETAAENYANSSTYLNAHVLPMIQEETSGLAVDSDYSYLKTALENQTTALGGLMLTSLIQLGATQSGSSWTVNSGISGVYDTTKTGNGIAAWYGGPMVDLADHLTDNPIPAHAKTLFRMDGSGYLADRRLYWSDQGDLHIQGNVTIDGQNYTETLNSILGYVMKLASWFVEDDTTMTGKTLLRINMGSQSSEGFDGLIFDGFLVTGGDQIVGSGTPGGGGGGAGYLYELGDIYHDTDKTKVLRTDGTTPAAVGDVLQLTSLTGGNKWAAVPATDIGRVYSGGTGITINGNTISVTANTYAPYNSAGYLPLSGGTLKNANYGEQLTIWRDSASADAVIVYRNGGGVLGNIGVSYDGKPYWTNDNGTTKREFWHTGNFTPGDYVLKAGDSMSGALTFSQGSSTRRNGIIGTYDANRAAAIWSMGSSYQIAADGMTMGNLYGACYAYYGSGYTYGAGKSGGHSFVWAQNGSPTVALGNNVWTSGGFIKNGGTSSQFLKADGSVDGTAYLPLAGGTISSGSIYSLYLNNSASGATYVGQRFQIGGTTYGSLLVGTDGNLYYGPNNGGVQTIYHSGNSNSTSVSWSASTLTANYAHLGNGGNVTNLELFGNASGTAIGFYKSGTRGALLYSNGDAPFVRYNGDWSVGYTIYDSGNANKSDVAWTASTFLCINGTDGGYFIKDTGGTNRRAMYLDSSNNFWVGYGTAHVGYNTYLDGNAIYLRYGTSHTTGITLNSSGSVGIGTDSPAYKLHVTGDIFCSSKIYVANTSNYLGISSSYLSINTVGNEITLSGTVDNQLFINYRKSANGYAPALFIWNAGTSSSYAQHRLGALDVRGGVTSTGDQVISSDINLKTHFKDITLTSEQIANAPAVSFDWKDGHGHSFGSIAQYWKPLVPEAVLGEEGSYTLAYGQLGTVLGINNGKAIFKLEQHETEQDNEIRKLREKVQRLEEDNLRLKARLGLS